MSPRSVDYTVISSERFNLGEGPLWSPRDGGLYWVDIRRPAVHFHRSGSASIETFMMPDLVSAVVVRERGGILVALKSAIAAYTPDTGELATVAAPEAADSSKRFNDGKCDRAGRFWAGTMNDKVRGDPSGALYCIDASNRCTIHDRGIGIPNGMAWSPDNKTMYFADTFLKLIYAYEFDLNTGTAFNRRVLIDLSSAPAAPDGSTVDADGFLWNAHYGAGTINRYDPDGKLERSIELPVSQPTSCTFGGPNLDILYVTSASQRMTAEQLAAEPLAGAVLACASGCKGLSEPLYRG